MSETIPDSTNDHPSYPAKGVPLPRPRKIMVDENDLWNLDDEWDAPETTKNETPAEISQAGIPQKQSSDYITRIEPTREKSFSYADVVEKMDPLPEELTETTDAREFIPLIDSASATSSITSPKNSSYSPIESDVWAGFTDDDWESPNSATSEDPAPEQQLEEIDRTTESWSTTETSLSDVNANEVPPSTTGTTILQQQAISASNSWTEAPTDAMAFSPENAEADLASTAQIVIQNTEIPAQAASFETIAPIDAIPQGKAIPLRDLIHPSQWKLTKLELTVLALSMSILVLLAVTSLVIFRKEIRTQDNPYLRANMPARGKMATVTSYESYWRQPLREGANADAARLDIIAIPEIAITLGDCPSPSGVIRVIFINAEGEIAGDTFTYSFRDGKFSHCSSPTATFAATTGFRSFGEQESYRARQIKPWSIRVYEGTDENAPSDTFRLLFSSAISTTRK
jgi:hypothetical protein